MQLKSLLLLPLVGLLAAEAQRPERGPRVDLGPARSRVIPGRFIIQVTPGQEGSVRSALEAQGAKILRTFKTDVFSGMSVFWSNHTLEEVQEVSNAIQTWRTQNYTLAAPVPIDRKIFARDTIANSSFLPWINADKAHAAGFTGRGVKIGVVDSGIDYTHPALGGCFGPGCKVAGGYDVSAGDPDPMDDSSDSHGTHVAGIIAGKSSTFSGVAPDATLFAYKVFGGSGGSSDVFIDAFTMAYNQGCDIITASLGGGDAWPDDGLATLSGLFMDQGVVVTVSAMNQGLNGVETVSDTAAGRNLIAVASIDNPVRPSSDPFVNVTGTRNGLSTTLTLRYVPANDVKAPFAFSAPWPIVPLTLNTSDDAQACGPLTPGGVLQPPTILLIKQAKACSLETQLTNIRDSTGIFVVLVYNNSTGPVLSPVTTGPLTGISTGAMSKADGEAIVSLYSSGRDTQARFLTLQPGEAQLDPKGGYPSDFTSMGPSWDLANRPDVAGIGGNVLSTVKGGWGLDSGTSMSCPMLAGSAALVISAKGGRSVHGKNTAKRIKARLVGSGRAIPWRTSHDLPPVTGVNAPAIQVGSGLVDVMAAINTTTQLTFDIISLNDTSHFDSSWNVVINNGGTAAVTYTFALQPGGGVRMQSTSNGGNYLAPLAEITPQNFVPSVVFPSGTFSVGAGQSRTATFRFTAPGGIDASKLPVYSGNIVIRGSNGDKLAVPYAGAAFDLKTQLTGKMFVPGTPKQASGPNGQDIAQYHTYNFNLSPSVASYPNITFDLKYGTKEIRWDIFRQGYTESQWRYPPVVGRNLYVGSATSFCRIDGATPFDPTNDDKNCLDQFPRRMARTYIPKLTNRYYLRWFGKLGNGTYIPPGNYVMRLAVLIPFADPTIASSWHVWNVPMITISPYTP